MITHNHEYFYKYVSSRTLLRILDSLKVKWSSPALFNDPFDLQIDPRFDFSTEDFIKALPDEMERLVFGSEEPVGDERHDLFRVIKLLRTTRHTLSRTEFSKAMKEPIDLGGREIAGKLEEWSKEWREFTSQLRIFCVTEVHDDLLMWAHYADCHKGAVVKLKCIPDFDTALCAALPVQYKNALPVIAERDEWVRFMLGCGEVESGEVIFKRFVCTKSTHWVYEKEWRVFSSDQSDDRSGFELSRLLPEEIDSIYLGCRMSVDMKREILERLEKNLRHVRVYEGQRSDSRFALKFTEISSANPAASGAKLKGTTIK